MNSGIDILNLNWNDYRGFKLQADRVKVIENATGKTTDLVEKVGELKNWKQIGVVVITASLSSI